MTDERALPVGVTAQEEHDDGEQDNVGFFPSLFEAAPPPPSWMTPVPPPAPPTTQQAEAPLLLLEIIVLLFIFLPTDEAELLALTILLLLLLLSFVDSVANRVKGLLTLLHILNRFPADLKEKLRKFCI